MSRWRRFRRPLLTPAGLLQRAVLVAAVFWVAHAAGLREYTSILCGMPPDRGWRSFLGAAYIQLYFGFVIVAPVLVLGAAIFALLLRWAPGRKAP